MELNVEYAYIEREDTWEFSDYVISGEIPMLYRGGDFVYVAKSGSNAILNDFVLNL